MNVSTYQYWADRNRFGSIGRALKHWVEHTYLKIILEHLAPAAPGRRPTLIEIGPGKGFFADVALEHFDYTSMETSPILAERLSVRGIPCILGAFPDDLAALDDTVFSCAYLSHVLEHFDTRSAAAAAVSKCAELLADDGILIINCPNYLSHGDLFWETDYTHNYVTTPSRVETLCQDCGLEVVATERMVFGFRNPVARALLILAGWLTPAFLLRIAMSAAVKGYVGNPKVYLKENFTIVARKRRPR